MDKPRFQILVEDKGGWVRVFLGRGEPTGEVAKYLSASLSSWLQERPHLRVTFALPVVRDGDTVEWHAWYEEVPA